jgi:hypothetical protein
MAEGKLDILLARIEQLEAAQSVASSENMILRQAILTIDPSLIGYFEACFDKLIASAHAGGVTPIAEGLEASRNAMRELADDAD